MAPGPLAALRHPVPLKMDLAEPLYSDCRRPWIGGPHLLCSQTSPETHRAGVKDHHPSLWGREGTERNTGVSVPFTDKNAGLKEEV